MKHLNVVVFVIIAAAVLIAAYAVGLLVRQARTPNVEPASQQVAEPNAAKATTARSIGQPRKQPTPEERAALEQKRAEQLDKMRNATEEEKQEYRNEMRQQLLAGAEEPGRPRRRSGQLVIQSGKPPVGQEQAPAADANAPATADANEE